MADAPAAEDAAAPAVAPPPAALAPAGLSKARGRRVVGKGTLDGGALIDLKMGLLNFMAAVGMKGEEALVHYLVCVCVCGAWRGSSSPLVSLKTSRLRTQATMRLGIVLKSGTESVVCSRWVGTHEDASIPTTGHCPVG